MFKSLKNITAMSGFKNYVRTNLKVKSTIWLTLVK